MATTVKEHQEVLLAYAKAGGVIAHAAGTLKLADTTYRRRLKEAKVWGKTKAGLSWTNKHKILIHDPGKPDLITLDLQRKIKELELRLTQEMNKELDTEEVRSFYLGLEPYNPVVPEWTTGKKILSEHGTPTLMLSDFHWMENVNPAEIFYTNDYNREIAVKRFRRVIDSAIYLLKDKIKHQKAKPFPGMVVILGGDMVSGIIHPELQETNEGGPMEMMIDCADNVAAGLRKLERHFGELWVVGVPGNHGRLTRKPMAKLNAVYNCDWGIYQMLERFLKDKRSTIHFNCPPARDLTYSVEGHRYRLTHGDQFRGGDGMIGPLGPITRGDHKKRSMAMSLPGHNEEYDTLLMGHFHQLHMLHSRIINGSLKGYDEYALSCNFAWEPAQQGMWLTHRKYGPNHYIPVFAQDPKPELVGKVPAHVAWRAAPQGWTDPEEEAAWTAS
ncbi:MAG: hypothetical protein V3S55_03895 [Nitrospiraceae bacterium]